MNIRHNEVVNWKITACPRVERHPRKTFQVLRNSRKKRFPKSRSIGSAIDIYGGEDRGNKDVLEVACGAGQGLGYLSSLSKTLYAGDITRSLVEQVKSHYGQRINIAVMDAMALPFDDSSLDVIILFEAIYYLPSAESFVNECVRGTAIGWSRF